MDANLNEKIKSILKENHIDDALFSFENATYALNALRDEASEDDAQELLNIIRKIREVQTLGFLFFS
jgi:hypothetical protein